MTQIVKFRFEAEIARFVDNEGREWFRGADVCRAIGISNAYKSITANAADYITYLSIGRGRPALYLSEPGLYRMIFASKSPKSERFKAWLFEEVLPAFRSNDGASGYAIALETPSNR